MAKWKRQLEIMELKERLVKYYTGKKIFVTGHTGFKGSWLLALLQQLGAVVKGYALAPEHENDLYNILSPQLNTQSIIGDIRNYESLKNEIISFAPDYIFHLAAQPLVRRSYKIPSETFDVNVTGTAHVLEAAMAIENHCNIVCITTDKVYENKETGVLYKEDDRLGGHDPYSASKACAEIVISSFRDSFFNTKNFATHHKSLASARAGNVIGGGDMNEDRIVPDIVKALMQNKMIDVRNPNSIRPWQHVLEPLCGYLLLGTYMEDDAEKYSTAYNFGPAPDDHLTVKKLVEQAIKIWESGEWKDCSSPNQPHEAGLLKLDISKAMKELNWVPKLNAKQAIEWTIAWYKKRDEEKIAYTFKQVEEYLQF